MIMMAPMAYIWRKRSENSIHFMLKYNYLENITNMTFKTELSKKSITKI